MTLCTPLYGRPVGGVHIYVCNIAASYVMCVCIYTAGGLQPFPPINIAPDISPDMAPPMAKKIRSEADDLIPEQQFIAEHPVRPAHYTICIMPPTL